MNWRLYLMISKMVMLLVLFAALLAGGSSFADDNAIVSQIASSAGTSGCYKSYTSGIPTYDYVVLYYDYIQNGMYRIRDANWSPAGGCWPNTFDNGRVVEARQMYKILVEAGKIRP